MSSSDSETLSFFFDEAHDILHKWEKLCLNYIDHQCPFDSDELFRYAHNLKGSAKMVGLEEMGHFVHQIEDVINWIRSGSHKITKKHINFFLDGHAIIEDWICQLSENHTYTPNTSEFIKKLADLENYTKKKSTETNSSYNQTNYLKIKIDSDLNIYTLKQFMKNFTIDLQKDYEIIIASNKIDTAGVQYLISLKKTHKGKIKFIYENQSVLQFFDTLGIRGNLL